MDYRTEQEAFWAGDFGGDYSRRNQGAPLLASNLAFFARALAQARGLGSCIEFGANIGMNLEALSLLYPGQTQEAVEINAAAAAELSARLPAVRVHNASLLDFAPIGQWDLALVKGVLIHINPDCLSQVYDLLVRACRRYVLICEYYNPSPVTISYRGHGDRLFKRDFCGEILDRHPVLQLIDYGFAYRRDPKFPQDDITWFLMEKRD